MRITIIVDDRRVGIDGDFIELPGLDWSRFDGDLDNPWDDISAVQYDTDQGQGHVEYRAIATKQSGRPNLKAPDWHIGADEFTAHFGWVIEPWTTRRAELDEMERLRAGQEPVVMPADEQIAELQQRVRELEDTLDRLGHTVASTLDNGGNDAATP